MQELVGHEHLGLSPSTIDTQSSTASEIRVLEQLPLPEDLNPPLLPPALDTPPPLDSVPIASSRYTGGVRIMADNSEPTASDTTDSESSGTQVSEDVNKPPPSSDDGNGSEYERKSLKELLTCYRDTDCGPGFTCEPFTCTKACSVYTNRQRVRHAWKSG